MEGEKQWGVWSSCILIATLFPSTPEQPHPTVQPALCRGCCFQASLGRGCGQQLWGQEARGLGLHLGSPRPGSSSLGDSACPWRARPPPQALSEQPKAWSPPLRRGSPFSVPAAGNAFCQAAQLHLQLQSKHDAATCFVDAGNAFKKADPQGEGLCGLLELAAQSAS